MRYFLLLAVLVGVAASRPMALSARAGGGDNYSSSSSHDSSPSPSSSGDSSHSSSYSGGGGSGGPVSDMVFCVAIGMIALLILVVLWKLVTEGLTTTTTTRRSETLDEALMNGPAIARHGVAVFKLIQEAWSKGDMVPVCGYLSDGVFERFEGLGPYRPGHPSHAGSSVRVTP